MKKVVSGYDCIPLGDFVTPLGATSLESILKREEINFNEVKVLSIDIDGNEYHILNGLKSLRPALVIAEYNPTIPPEMNVVSKEDAFFGSSARALTDLMQEKRYTLIAMTKTNCFFIENSLSSLFADLDTSFERLFDRSCLTYLITGYRGAYAYSQAPAYGIGLPIDSNLIERGDLFYIRYSSLRVKWNYFKDSIKAITKSFLGVKNITAFKSYCLYLLWLLKGMSIPAHRLYKWQVLRKYAKKHNLDVFLETGTAGGVTVSYLKKYFKKLYTIELDPTLYHQGRALTHDYKNIICVEGDSGVMINDIVKKISEPTLFWLDAHYSGEGTAKADVETPIIKELVTIFSRNNKKDVILIDDARCFDGTHDYPTIKQIDDLISSYGYLSFNIAKDIMIIEPKL